MSLNDTDPLADAPASRHAFESDDEDEEERFDFDYPSPAELRRAKESVEVHVSLEDESRRLGVALIFANGSVGAAWARGADLGQQVGQVNVNRRAIGLIFRPTWMSGAVIVSEVRERLPVACMNAYAHAILGFYQPSCVSLLESYSSSTYITSSPVPHQHAPIRCLSSDNLAHAPEDLSLFEPPNMLQSSVAALLALLSCPRGKQHVTPALAILLPSRRTPLPVPSFKSTSDPVQAQKSFVPSSSQDLLLLSEEDDVWDASMLRSAHKSMLQACGMQSDASSWVETKGMGTPSATTQPQRRYESDGMYI